MLKVYEKKSGDVTILCLQGQLVTGEAETLREAVLSQFDALALVLDLRGVSRIDAGGLGVLLELRAHTLSKGIEFGLTNVTRLVQQVLEITHLDSVFENLTERSERAATFHDQLSTVLRTAPCA